MSSQVLLLEFGQGPLYEERGGDGEEEGRVLVVVEFMHGLEGDVCGLERGGLGLEPNPTVGLPATTRTCTLALVCTMGQV